MKDWEKENKDYWEKKDKEESEENKKTIIWLLSITIGLFLVFFTTDWFFEAQRESSRKDYCGLVHSLGYDPPSSGYKSSRSQTYWVIIEHKGRFIRVHVTPNTYYKLRVGNSSCFSLNNCELKNYGN